MPAPHPPEFRKRAVELARELNRGVYFAAGVPRQHTDGKRAGTVGRLGDATSRNVRASMPHWAGANSMPDRQVP